MDLNDIPLMAMLKHKLGYINARQKVLSENVANADTPGYAPRDLKPFSFAAMVGQSAGGTQLARTAAGHLAPAHACSAGGDGDFADQTAPDSETRVDGNQVVLEDQMMKMTEARIDYETAVDLYQQSLNLITTAARAPAKG